MLLLVICLVSVFAQISEGAAQCGDCSAPTGPGIISACDEGNNLGLTCDIEKIRSANETFDRISCTGGEWFGTSCDGTAKYLTATNPIACGEVVKRELCSFDRVDDSTVFTSSVLSLPQPSPTDPHSFSCKQRFFHNRLAHRIGDVVEMWNPYSGGGWVSISGPIKCVVDDAAAQQYHFESSSGERLQEQIFCAAEKCPEGSGYDAETGKCKGHDHWFEGAAALVEQINQQKLKVFDEVPLSLDGVQAMGLYVSEGCKCTVFGKAELLSDMPAGVWRIPNRLHQGWVFDGGLYSDDAIAKNVTCSCLGKADNVTVTLNGVVGKEMNWQFSHENRFLYIQPAYTVEYLLDRVDFLPKNPFRFGASFSITGIGNDGMFVKLITTNGRNLVIGISFTENHIQHYYDNNWSNSVVRTVAFGSKKNFNLKLENTGNTVSLSLNGQLFVSFPIPYAVDEFAYMTIDRWDVKVHSYHFFIPKECPPHHIFSHETAECEYTGSIEEGGTITYGGEEWPIRDGMTIPDGALKALVRAGCSAQFSRDNTLLPILSSINFNKMANEYFTTVPALWPLNLPSIAIYRMMECGAGTAYNSSVVPNRVKITCEDDTGKRNNETLPEYKLRGNVLTTTILLTAFVREHPCGTHSIQLCSDFGAACPLYVKILDEGTISGWKDDYGTLKDAQFFANVVLKPNELADIRIRLTGIGFEMVINGLILTVHHELQEDMGEWTLKLSPGLLVQRIEELTPKTVPYRADFETGSFLYGDSLHVKGIMKGEFAIEMLTNKKEPVFLLETDSSAQKMIISGPDFESLTGGATSLTFPLAVDAMFDMVLVNKLHAIEVYVNGELIAPMRHRTKYPEEYYATYSISGNVQLLDVKANYYK